LADFVIFNECPELKLRPMRISYLILHLLC
jgi:hypothetical protein